VLFRSINSGLLTFPCHLFHQASVPALIKVLKDPNEHEMVRHESAEGFISTLNILSFSVLNILSFSGKALGSIATPEVMPILEEFRKDEKRVVRESCDVALDMYEYENSGQFQYADGISKLQKESQH